MQIITAAYPPRSDWRNQIDVASRKEKAIAAQPPVHRRRSNSCLIPQTPFVKYNSNSMGLSNNNICSQRPPLPFNSADNAVLYLLLFIGILRGDVHTSQVNRFRLNPKLVHQNKQHKGGQQDMVYCEVRSTKRCQKT